MTSKGSLERQEPCVLSLLALLPPDRATGGLLPVILAVFGPGSRFIFHLLLKGKNHVSFLCWPKERTKERACPGLGTLRKGAKNKIKLLKTALLL
jgi:hypothetical protein